VILLHKNTDCSIGKNAGGVRILYFDIEIPKTFDCFPHLKKQQQVNPLHKVSRLSARQDIANFKY
jgi:hypothetical protein